jgi:hypothetical protein
VKDATPTPAPIPAVASAGAKVKQDSPDAVAAEHQMELLAAGGLG